MDYTSLSANELAVRCADAQDREAWAEFVRRFARPIALVALRTCRQWGEPSSSVVDDLVQDTFLRLCASDCKLLRSFQPREPDSIIGFIKVIAANVAHDHFRSVASLKRGGGSHRVGDQETDGTAALSAPYDAHAIDTGLQLAEIFGSLETLTPEVSARDRLIFELYYRQGFSAREIAEMPAFGLTVKGAESSIHRLTALLRGRLAPSPPVAEKGKPQASPISIEGS